MKVAQMTCVHKWQIDRQNVGTCSLCGEVRQFPLEKGQDPVVLKKGNRLGKKHTRKSSGSQTIREAWLYHNKNKEAIMADLFAIGNTATCKKWGIKPQTMAGLKKRWLTEEERARISRQPGGRPSSTAQSLPPSTNGRLPHFPEFSGTWDPSVQLKWLDVYENLHGKGGKQ